MSYEIQTCLFEYAFFLISHSILRMYYNFFDFVWDDIGQGTGILQKSGKFWR